MLGYSSDQIRAAEAPLLAAGVPLMARAAHGLADVIASLAPTSVLLLVGTGDNGGDALFAGAELAASGIDVRIVRTGSRVHEAGFAAALDAGAVETDDPVGFAGRADVVVDGILGTGTSASPALRSPARELVESLIPVARRVVAVDLPSGISPDDGTVPSPVVLRADITVTFGGCKAGLLLEPGSSYAGDVRLIDIGLDLSKVEPVIGEPTS
jgi:hydroxyethylthiazole kinase-like uncharacterized protein yjeF